MNNLLLEVGYSRIHMLLSVLTGALLAVGVTLLLTVSRVDAYGKSYNVKCFSGGKLIYSLSNAKDFSYEHEGYRFTINTKNTPSVIVRGSCIVEEIK